VPAATTATRRFEVAWGVHSATWRVSMNGVVMIHAAG
jgi:hypothetical protein